jgi:hypothetical protein
MKKHVLVVQSNALAGRDDEFNQWYTETHLDDVLRVPGMLSAQRFKIAAADPGAKHKYLAIYEFEADDPATVLASLNSRAGTPDMMISQAMDMQTVAMAPWCAVTEKVVKLK